MALKLKTVLEINGHDFEVTAEVKHGAGHFLFRNGALTLTTILKQYEGSVPWSLRYDLTLHAERIEENILLAAWGREGIYVGEVAFDLSAILDWLTLHDI